MHKWSSCSTSVAKHQSCQAAQSATELLISNDLVEQLNPLGKVSKKFCGEKNQHKYSGLEVQILLTYVY